MAYVSKEAKATIAQNLKPVLKKYGVKATLAVSNHRTIVLNVRESAIDFLSGFDRDHVSVNTYWTQDHYTGAALAFLTEALQALRSAGWYDRSDIMTDYFNTAYYIDINIGTWDKPYVLTQREAA